MDVLAIDHTGTSDLTTIPPARTIAVPGSRRAIGRAVIATVTTADGRTGTVPIPDWLGAVLLKARAAVVVTYERSKHLQDLALLLGLPIDVTVWSEELAGRDRWHLRAAATLLTDDTWRAVSGAIQVPDALSTLHILT